MRNATAMAPASTDVTIQVRLYDATTGEPITGVTIANLDLWYIRVETDNDVTISAKVDISALTALTDAHADNKAYEIGKGYYRVDLPDAVFATGARFASIVIEDGTGSTILSASVDFDMEMPCNLSEVGGSTTVMTNLTKLAAQAANVSSMAKSTGVLTIMDTDGTTPLYERTRTDNTSTLDWTAITDA